MNNLPKIFANCPAGCLWETVHREEFNRAATYLPIRLDSGETYVDPLNKYKIETPSADGAYTCVLNVLLRDNSELGEDDGSGSYYSTGINIPLADAYDAYRDYFYFEVLDFSYIEDEFYRLTYELNGNRKTYEFTDTTDFSLVGVSVADAIAVYRFNEDAEIVAKDGKDGAGVPAVTKDDNGKVLRVVGGAWAASEDAIPTFDLVTLGLPAIAPDGEGVLIETDTADILAALNKGAVKFIVGFNVGVEIKISLVMSPACVTASGEYSCSSINEFNGSMMITTISAADGGISVKCTPMENIIGAYINIALGGDY